MVALSVIILAKNEAEDIGRCLKSVLWAEERIVVDSGSTDQTKVIAGEFATKVVDRAFTNFADQRNWALEQARFDWVLMVDADEVVSEELRKEVEQAVAMPGVNGFFIPRIDYTFGKWLKYGETGKKSFSLLRLARKGKGKWVYPIHEVWEVEGRVGKLSHPILHYSHPDLEEFLEKLNRYTTADAEAMFREGKRTAGWTIFVYPFAKFFVNYIWKLGFMDGVHGLVFAFLMAFYSFAKRAKLWVLWWEAERKGRG